MSLLSFKRVKIAGLSACVPRQIEENIDLTIFSDRADAEMVIAATGIERRRVCRPGTTASDLAVPAVERLISELGWEKESIDSFVYVSASRDYIAPQTSCILQDRLGLSQGCFVLDLPLGCSGWIHGVATIGSLTAQGTFRRGLLVNAETNTKNRSPKDRTVRPLFGDAAAVTAFEYDENFESPFRFSFGVDGSGADAIMAKYGGMRFPVTPESLEEKEISPGVVRRGVDMAVNGMDVAVFATSRPPKSLKEFIETYNVNVDDVDLFLLHQANKFIDEKIRKSVKIPLEKTPYSLQDFGNVTNVSIPLTLVRCCREALTTKANRCLACGFGVGLAWGTLMGTLDRIVCPELLEYDG